MKCLNCGSEMAKVYECTEHPGPEGQPIEDPGLFCRYECKQCGIEIECKEEEEKP